MLSRVSPGATLWRTRRDSAGTEQSGAGLARVAIGVTKLISVESKSSQRREVMVVELLTLDFLD
jgi:hypothetical protein